MNGAPVAAQSCPCPPYDLAAIVERSDVIVVGKVLSATDDSAGAMQQMDGTWWGGAQYQTRVMVEVSTVLKGKAPRFVEVVTPAGACGFVFLVGKSYLVAAQGLGALVVTDVCHGNAAGDAIDTRARLIREALHSK